MLSLQRTFMSVQMNRFQFIAAACALGLMWAAIPSVVGWRRNYFTVKGSDGVEHVIDVRRLVESPVENETGTHNLILNRLSLIVVFSGTECSSCLDQIQRINALTDERIVEVVGVLIDTSPNETKQLAELLNIRFKLWRLASKDQALVAKLKLATPFKILVSHNGGVQWAAGAAYSATTAQREIDKIRLIAAGYPQ
jgi:hypothetical protein